jgi:DMSO/TMAO reductase YedYZ molybdopterin-dependent catalytic subunit
VNTSAVAAGVAEVIRDAGYRLVLSGPSGRRELTLPELAGLPQTTVESPITCVEGWSASGRWTGVRVSELAAIAPIRPGVMQTKWVTAVRVAWP